MVLLITLLLAVIIGYPVQAQVETGAICVMTFADLNADGQRDPNETPLAGVNVNLMTGGVIIATHITQEGETEYCFENLLAADYTVVFTDSPLYRITTGYERPWRLEAGQRVIISEFGAFPIPIENLRAEVAAQNAKADEPLDEPTRLMLATGGSMMVMLFMIGVGAVILGLLSGRTLKRPKNTQNFAPVNPPMNIKPPGR